jgi:cohesin complex subunit SCC1
MRLLEIRADPVTHFMPTRVTNEGTFFCAAPPGMAPELAEMFMFPTTSGRRPRDDISPAREPPPKRARTATEEPDVELPRRERSQARSIQGTEAGRMSFGPEGDITGADLGGFDDSFHMDVDFAPEVGGDLGGDMMASERGTPRPRATPGRDATRLSTPGLDI